MELAELDGAEKSYAKREAALTAELDPLKRELEAAQAACAALKDAIEFVDGFFQKLEDNTEPDDPLFQIRKRYHAPPRKKMAEALAAYLSAKSALEVKG